MYQTKRTTVPEAEEILGRYFPVLDHGFVSLVDYMGSDEDVERAARVSYGHGTRKKSATRGLVRYLRRHMHTTPSEMVELKFHCSMPMFVARQWVRHRTANINEYSGRYSLMPLIFYSPTVENFAFQSKVNNQGRETTAAASDLYSEAIRRWNEIRELASDGYSWLVGEDIARELARIDLPLSTYTQWYWKIDLHNLFHFLTLRADTHAQWEIQEYARVMAGMLKRVAPLSFEAWVDYQYAGTYLSRMEREILAQLLVVDDNGLHRKQHAPVTITPNQLKEAGLSKREIEELRTKLMRPVVNEFELDLSRMRAADEIAAEVEVAVPKVDRKEGA